MDKLDLIRNELGLASSRRQHWELEMEKLNASYTQLANQLKLSREIEKNWRGILKTVETGPSV